MFMKLFWLVIRLVFECELKILLLSVCLLCFYLLKIALWGSMYLYLLFFFKEQSSDIGELSLILHLIGVKRKMVLLVAVPLSATMNLSSLF